VVLNNLGAPGTLTRKQVVQGLGTDVDVVVPWLPKQMHAATTLGQPAIRRRGPFQAAISQLADEVLPQRVEPTKSWLGWRRKVSKA
jgi:hypothetical protein